MPRYNEYVVDKVAKAMFNVRWKGSHHWEESPILQEMWREWAKAALEAIDSLYESEAEQPVEYAGIEGGL